MSIRHACWVGPRQTAHHLSLAGTAARNTSRAAVNSGATTQCCAPSTRGFPGLPPLPLYSTPVTSTSVSQHSMHSLDMLQGLGRPRYLVCNPAHQRSSQDHRASPHPRHSTEPLLVWTALSLSLSIPAPRISKGVFAEGSEDDLHPPSRRLRGSAAARCSRSAEPNRLSLLAGRRQEVQCGLSAGALSC